MKKLALVLALAGLTGSISASSLTKGDDKDKNKKECCKKEGKSCCKKGEGKACAGEKKAEGSKETKETTKAEEKK